MSLTQAFGVGRLFIEGKFQNVSDHVVPNHVCTDWQSLAAKLPSYPTAPEILRNPPFTRRPLAFARRPDIDPFPNPIEAAYLEGDKVMACEATWDGVPHYFLGWRLRQRLQVSGQSVVRRFVEGNYCSVPLDTRATPWAFDAPPIRRQELDTPASLEEFWENGHDPDGFVTDYATGCRGLVFFSIYERHAELTGSVDPASPVTGYVAVAGDRVAAPLEDGLEWTAFKAEGNTVAAYRERGATHFRRAFLTREGYAFLRRRDMAIFRAFRPTEGASPKQLKELWLAREVQP